MRAHSFSLDWKRIDQSSDRARMGETYEVAATCPVCEVRLRNTTTIGPSLTGGDFFDQLTRHVRRLETHFAQEHPNEYGT